MAHFGVRTATRAVPLLLRLKYAAVLAAAVILLSGIRPAVAVQLCVGQVDPNSMKVEGQVNPLYLSKVAPLFSWTHPGPGSQTNWQVELDSQSDFLGHGSNIWFWESGTGDKGALDSATSVNWGAVYPAGQYPRPLDTRADLIYWRVRTQNNNDSSWANDPNRFTCGVVKLNQIPLPAENVAVTETLTSGSQGAFSFPPPVSNPHEYFVSTSGSDTNPGTQSLPFRTINKGVKAAGPGDTVSVRAGTYGENVQITAALGVAAGTIGNPITLRRFPGDGPVIVRGGLSGPQPISTISIVGSATQPMDNWIVDGLTIGGSGVSFGVYVYIGNRNIIQHIGFESGFNSSAVGVRLQGAASDNMVLDSVFNRPMYYQLEVTSADHTIVRGNDFSNGNGQIVISFHSSASFAGIIENNVIHDTSAVEGAIQLYLSSDGAVVRNNTFYNITQATNGNTAAVQVMRCGKVLIENNTMVNTRRGIGYLEFSRYIVARNNVIANSQFGFDFDELLGSPPGSTAVGAQLLYNYSFNNQFDILFRYPSDDPLVNKVGNCFGAACDPKFVNVSTNDFRLQAGSPLIDAGDPNSPVPVGGGSRVDIGAYESGATRPYEYQPLFTIADDTPKISWSLLDPDNLLHAFDPSSFPGTDFQTAFELEIDTSPRFNSVRGNRPIFSSGVITSGTQSYTVPDADRLPNGMYYVRVRQRDQHQPGGMGAWSNNNIRFEIGGEPASPYIDNLNPADGAMAVDPNTTVSVHVLDSGSGVDESTIMMNIGVDDPNAPTAVSPQISQVGTGFGEYAVVFTPSAGLFTPGSTVFVRMRADDLFGSPPLDQTYSFQVADNQPPPIPMNLRVTP